MLNKILFKACFTMAYVYTASVFAQDYPEKPLRVIQGYVAGGNTDTIARIVRCC